MAGVCKTPAKAPNKTKIENHTTRLYCKAHCHYIRGACALSRDYRRAPRIFYKIFERKLKNMFIAIDLEPCREERAKSFYGKAKVVQLDNGDIALKSYDTFVCKITAEGKFIRTWGGYSHTTMRHVKSFIRSFGFSGGGTKSWWDSLPIGQ